MRWPILPFLIGTVLVPGSVRAEQESGQVLRCTMARPDQGRFSGVAAISRGPSISIEPRGVLAEAGSPPITDATRFNIGSAGKMFTAVAIGQLMEAGKVRLDDRVGQYIKELPPETAAITVRQLLTHTSGLGNFFNPDTVAALQRIERVADLMPFITSDKPHFPPGTRFDYSNTGFALLGVLVERLSGESYGDYLNSRIFRPAGMTSTGLSFVAGTTARGLTGDALPPRQPGALGPRDGPPPGERPGPPPQGEGTASAAADDKLHPSPESAMPATPAGGLYSNPADLVRFFRALAAGKLLSMQTVRSFTGRQVDAAPPKGDLPALYYGFGFGTGSFEGHRWFGHNGGAPGVNAEAIMFPDDDLVIVTLANRDPPMATALFRALRAALLQRGAVPPSC